MTKTKPKTPRIVIAHRDPELIRQARRKAKERKQTFSDYLNGLMKRALERDGAAVNNKNKPGKAK
jgi:hypothetical protein